MRGSDSKQEAEWSAVLPKCSLAALVLVPFWDGLWLSFRTTGSFVLLHLDACHRVVESGFSFAHPKSLITSK